MQYFMTKNTCDNNQARIIGSASLAQKSASISNVYSIKSCQVNINIIQFYFVLFLIINYLSTKITVHLQQYKVTLRLAREKYHHHY